MTITLGASAVGTKDIYNGSRITIKDAGGTNEETVTISSYSETTKIATLSSPLLVTRLITAKYSISAFNNKYSPHSKIDSTSKSLTFYFFKDSILHVLTGARGTFSIDFTVSEVPVYKWSFTGLLGTISDDTTTARSVSDFVNWDVPVPVSTQNTTGINLHGFTSGMFKKLTIDVGNTVVHRNLVGSESVLITNRKPKASVEFEATSIASKDWFNLASSNAVGAFSFIHGVANPISLSMPSVQISNPKYSESDGIVMITMDLIIIATDSGDNELIINA
jgi:hypothetical protein